jgi:hypothetical protein
MSILPIKKLDHDPRMNNISNDLKSSVQLKNTINKAIEDKQPFGTHTKFEVTVMDRDYTLRLLSRKELDYCLMTATEYYNAIPESSRHISLFNHEYMVLILSHAISLCPEDKESIQSNALVYNNSTISFLHELYQSYNFIINQTHAECDKITDDELLLYIEKTKNDLGLISLSTRPQLIRALIYYILKDAYNEQS